MASLKNVRSDLWTSIGRPEVRDLLRLVGDGGIAEQRFIHAAGPTAGSSWHLRQRLLATKLIRRQSRGPIPTSKSAAGWRSPTRAEREPESAPPPATNVGRIPCPENTDGFDVLLGCGFALEFVRWCERAMSAEFLTVCRRSDAARLLLEELVRGPATTQEIALRTGSTNAGRMASQLQLIGAVVKLPAKRVQGRPVAVFGVASSRDVVDVLNGIDVLAIRADAEAAKAAQAAIAARVGWPTEHGAALAPVAECDRDPGAVWRRARAAYANPRKPKPLRRGPRAPAKAGEPGIGGWAETERRRIVRGWHALGPRALDALRASDEPPELEDSGFWTRSARAEHHLLRDWRARAWVRAHLCLLFRSGTRLGAVPDLPFVNVEMQLPDITWTPGLPHQTAATFNSAVNSLHLNPDWSPLEHRVEDLAADDPQARAVVHRHHVLVLVEHITVSELHAAAFDRAPPELTDCELERVALWNSAQIGDARRRITTRPATSSPHSS